MKIYLAGKVSENDWRQKLVPKETLMMGRDLSIDTPYEEDPAYCANWSWKTVRFGFSSGHDYVGPFYMPFASLGSFPKHNAVDGYCRNTHDMELYAGRSRVARLCFEAIEKADLVFAWIDDVAAYGTCAELGYAAALGKQTYVNTSKVPDKSIGLPKKKIMPTPLSKEDIEFDWYHPRDQLSGDDYWLPETLSTIEIDETATGGDIKTTFDAVVSMAETVYYPMRREYLLSRVVDNSEIERILIKTMYDCEPKMLDLLQNQYAWESYRLDFAIPEIKLCIELDGHDSHKSKEARSHDAERDRKLLKYGWTTIRYTGSEIYKNPMHQCIDLIGHAERMLQELFRRQ